MTQSNSLCKRLAKSDEHQFLNDEEEIGKTEMGLAHRFGRVGCGYHKPLKQKESGVMYLDKHFALRLDNACNRMDLQVHLRRFLNIWTKARATSSACKDALKELGRALDQKGRWHESETVIDLGLKEVAREERNAARDRVLLAGVGGLILTLVAGRLARKLFA